MISAVTDPVDPVASAAPATAMDATTRRAVAPHLMRVFIVRPLLEYVFGSKRHALRLLPTFAFTRIFRTMEGLRTQDLRAIVAFLGNASTIDAPVPYTSELLDRLTALIGCDYATYNEFDFARRTVVSYVVCSEGQEFWELTESEWDGLVAELVSDRDVEQDGIVTTSDRLPYEQRTRFEGVPDLSAELGIIDQMCVRIGPPGARFVLERCDRDFDARDRMLMRELQPHLFEMWRRASVRRQLHAALAALDDDEAEGVVFVSAAHDVEFASASAERLLQTHLGSAIPLPSPIVGWLENGRDGPLVIANGDSELVISTTDGGTTLVLREEAVGRHLLTRREFEVMRYVAAGLTNEEIARRLWIEVPTVRKHLEHVFDKLGVRNRTAAVAALRLLPTQAASL
jgi:DNA-binding CsgD family transcriptional regulator